MALLMILMAAWAGKNRFYTILAIDASGVSRLLWSMRTTTTRGGDVVGTARLHVERHQWKGERVASEKGRRRKKSKHV